MKDFFGVEIAIGDTVALVTQYSFVMGTVTAFTAKTILVDCGPSRGYNRGTRVRRITRLPADVIVKKTPPAAALLKAS